MIATQELLDATFAALADPTRRAMLARLARGEATVSELAAVAVAPMSQPAISRHIKVLERAGLISRGRDRQYRPCRLEPGPLKQVSDWTEKHRQLWEQNFSRLDDYLKTVRKKR